jgi:hypothetical protein
MTKSKDGIEQGQYQTSGVNDDVMEGEAKPRGGDGSAVMKQSKAMPSHHFAHKRPVTDRG